MSSRWRKRENENGIPYYINDKTNEGHWDHPKFSDIRQRLDECNNIKYSNYRVASKIRVLQNALYMEEVSLTVIAGVFERHRLGANESSLCLETCDIEAVLTDIYFATNKQNHINTDIDFAAELMINFLYNVFDKERSGKIQVSSTKLLLGLLSNCQLSDFNHYLFSLCADHNNCVTRLRLRSVLSKLSKITAFMHEDVSFGQHLVNSAIEDCFSNSPGLVGINESAFVGWLDDRPQLTSWIPTFHRLKSAESVVHPMKCSVCKTIPITGLRYKCVKCSKYVQCQNCFMTGRISHSHKLTHSMKEYCSEGNTRDFAQALVKKLCGLMTCSTQSRISTNLLETRATCNGTKVISNSDDEADIQPLSSPQTQLQIVIRQLELQNSELHQMLLVSNHNDKEIRNYLEEHRLHVEAQIKKLKKLKNYLTVSQPVVLDQNRHPSNALQSTPMIRNGQQNTRLGLDAFSPIMQIPECSFPSEESSDFDGRKVTHAVNGTTNELTENSSVPSYSVRDISTWIGGKPEGHCVDSDQKAMRKSRVRPVHTDLDDALAKLQQILANNFTLDESLGNVNIDNGQLKYAVTEVEGMLTSFIDSVETSRANSVQPNSLH